MIFPVPMGINPNSHLCGCGGMLLMPWRIELNGHALRCTVDSAHDTYQPKYSKTRELYDPDRGYVEVDVTTGKETASLVVLDQTTALEKVQRASALGLFPDRETSPEQLHLLAQVALSYGLDPLMGEIIPYQGKPYITIAGRRRLDAVAGHHPSIAFRLLNTEERTYYTELAALNPGDVAGFCVLTTEYGARVEGFGRVLAKQRSKTQRGAEHLPTVQYDIEMAQKRQERRAREMAYGPVPRPEGLGTLTVLQEGDEANVVEGMGRLVPPDSPPQQTAATNYGSCPLHPEEQWRTSQYGLYHKDGTEWCRFIKVMGIVFRDAVLARHGTYEQKAWNEWLKEVYGATWSKLTPDQMVAAIATIKGNQPNEAPPQVDAPVAEEVELPG